MRKYLWLSLLAALMVSLLAFAACSDDDDDEDGGNAEEIAAVEEVISAIASTDPSDQAQVDFWLAHMSDEVIEGFFGTTREECAANAEECIGEPTPADRLEGTEVSGDTAQTTVTDVGGSVFTVRFVSETDTWIVSEIRFGPAEVPAGVTGIDLELSEYAFGFNRGDIEDGNIAFPFENVGEEPHEVLVLKTNADFDLEAFLGEGGEEEGGAEEAASPSPGGEEDEGGEDELPLGVDAFFFGGIAGPGGGGVAVFPEPFEPGTYTLVCMLPDPEGTPHAALGMTAEFEVPAE